VKLIICETDIAHRQEKAKESNIREVKYWKGDQPKSMQSNDREELIIYFPGLWETPEPVCKICIVHPDLQSFRRIYFP
jgi:hypothetical protein